MIDFYLAIGSCFLAGVITTLHPCPLTTNVASVTLLSGWSVKHNNTGLTIFFFILGYIFSYLFLSIIISSGFLSIPTISLGLHKSIYLFLGPFLILAGMIINDIIRLQGLYKGRILSRLQNKNWTGFMAFPFGSFIALSFCPATAAVFFGLLIPLSVKYEQMFLFPSIYAFGASIPLILVSVLISKGSTLNKKFTWKTKVQKIAGWFLIILGIYISIQRIYLT